jgi:hypothetical protein
MEAQSKVTELVPVDAKEEEPMADHMMDIAPEQPATPPSAVSEE